MNAKIICQNISKEKVKEAFNLGEYQKGDLDICGIKYKMYGSGEKIIIAFEDEFDFCQLAFVMIDLLEFSRKDQRNVQGFVNTNPSNKVTEYLKGERICFYLSEELKQALKTHDNKYLDILNIVTESNQNFSIDIDHFFSYRDDDTKIFQEPNFELFNFELIEEGELLYEKGNFEMEYLEDLETFKQLNAS